MCSYVTVCTNNVSYGAETHLHIVKIMQSTVSWKIVAFSNNVSFAVTTAASLLLVMVPSITAFGKVKRLWVTFASKIFLNLSMLYLICSTVSYAFYKVYVC